MSRSHSALTEEVTTIKILPVIYRDGGFMTQPFAFGGEDGPEAFDASMRYRSCLQNYLIDTGDEVILVDTGLPAGTPEESPDENTPIYTGHDVLPYMEALAALGYAPNR
ncbi:MAG: hypothetical protein IKF96_02155 [Eggerthellaceae bacterium]|nr:hypothetical protein [Eggerthellaceae bacterium]